MANYESTKKKELEKRYHADRTTARQKRIDGQGMKKKKFFENLRKNREKEAKAEIKRIKEQSKKQEENDRRSKQAA